MLENRLSEMDILVGEIQGFSGKKEQEKVVEPKTQDVVVLPDDSMKVLSKVTVKGVTAEIDKNIKAENIRLGVNILGIEGNVEPDKPNQEKTIYPSEIERVVVADTGFELGRVIAKPVETESFEITPNASEQVVRASHGKWIKQVVVGAVEDVSPEVAAQVTLLNDLEAQVNELSDKDDTALKILNNTLERFDNNQYGLTSLREYQFKNNLNMKYIDLTGIKSLSLYCCSGLKNVETIILEDNLTFIDGSALNSVGSLTDKTFNIKTAENAGIGQYALAGSNVKKVELDVRTPFSSNALNSCTKLTDVSIKINSGTYGAEIGSYAFFGCTNVENFHLEPDYIKTFGSWSFRYFGKDRPNPENNVFIFRPIRTQTLNQGCFRDCCYFDVFFSSWSSGTSSINANAFQSSDHCCLYCTDSVPQTLNASAFGSGDTLATNYKIFVPYDNITTYKTATNWTTHADYIFGWAEENKFEQDATLPTTSAEGLTLTWYSDKDMTTQVTTADDPSKIYYCVGV